MKSEQDDGPQLSFLDRVILWLLPSWGLRRLIAKGSAERFYEAAQGSRRTRHWFRRSSDANAAAAKARGPLRELSRDARRNNRYAKNAIGIIADKVVGYGIMPRAAGVDPDINVVADAIWKRRAEAISFDYDGRLNVYGLQHLTMQGVPEAGSMLAVRRWRDDDDGEGLSLRIQMLEPDYLDCSRDGPLIGGGEIDCGVEFDRQGRRVGYHLYDEHPGAMRRAALRSRLVPADDVIHVFDIERAGQSDGIGWMGATLVKINELDDTDDAVLTQAKMAGMFGIVVSDPTGEADGVGEIVDQRGRKLEKFQPGMVLTLPGGKTVSFPTPPAMAANMDSFTRQGLRGIAAGIGGISGSELSLDFQQLSFSAARLERISTSPRIHKWRWLMLIPHLCDGLWRWVMQDAVRRGELPEAPPARWTPPPTQPIDPEKEGKAFTASIRSGQKTLLESIREQGGDPTAHLDEIEEGDRMVDARKIVLDSDARYTTINGQRQGSGKDGAGGPKESGWDNQRARELMREVLLELLEERTTD